jgi:SPP1 gp7 family putative phage head morphogenesis protein
MKKVCAAVLHRDEHTDALFKPIYAYVEDVFEFPVIDILTDFGVDMRRNAKETALTAAILAGVIYYHDGVFTGSFDAQTSKELRSYGAEFSKSRKAFRLASYDVPLGVRHAASVAKGKSEDLHKEIAAVLFLIAGNVEASETDINTTATAKIVDRDIVAQLKKTMPEGFTVPDVKLSIDELATLQAQVDEAIKKNVAEAALELAAQIEANRANGANLERLRELINIHFEKLKKRAKSIAEHQTALFIAKERERLYKSLGINSYIWQTRLDDRVRPDHRVLEGNQFSWDSPPVTNRATGAHNHPGEDFNCLPCDSKIEFAYGVKKAFRRWYNGKLAFIVLESGKTVRATPNHQVLTVNGWKAIGSLNNSDYIIELSDELIQSSEGNINNRVSTIGDIFASLSELFGGYSVRGVRNQFHGDGSDCEVNIVGSTCGLWTCGKNGQGINQLSLACANSLDFKLSQFQRAFFPINRCFSGSRGDLPELLNGGFFKSNNIRLGTVSDKTPIGNQNSPYRPSGNTHSICNRKLALSFIITLYNNILVYTKTIMRRPTNAVIGINSDSPKFTRDCVGVNADNLSDFFKRFPSLQKTSRIVDFGVTDFSGHVYNLETESNWYTSEGIAIHNCRCAPLPIVNINE